MPRTSPRYSGATDSVPRSTPASYRKHRTRRIGRHFPGGQLDPAEISAREAEVLAALGTHLSDTKIANRLHISVRTVESHVQSLLRA